MEVPSIQKLDESVICRIAAGEVIHQPTNVVKELIENCIDANASRITVSIENGGFSLIKVADDGTGIKFVDLPNACKRHTTSKLREYSDLSRIATFGFRGEALFSMSCCSYMSITTRTETDEAGFFGKYQDGELISQLERVRANTGTTVEIRNLFYNNPIRLKTSTKAASEIRKIADTIAKYSVVYPKISFIMNNNGKEWYRSVGNSTFDSVLRRLYEIENSDNFFKLVLDVGLNSSAELFLSSPGNTRAPKSCAVFINGRLVSCKKLERAIEAVYTDVIPRGSTHFFFAVLTLPPESVDVNVHPSKKEVMFLNEGEIIETISSKVKESLEEHQNTRVVEYTLKERRSAGNTHSQQKRVAENQSTIDQYQIPEVEPEEATLPSDMEDFGNDFAVPDDSPPETPIRRAMSEASDDPSVEEEIPVAPEKPERAPIMLSDHDDEWETPSKPLPPVRRDAPVLQKPKSRTGKLNVFDEIRFEPANPKVLPDPGTRTIEQVLTSAPKTIIPRAFRSVDLDSVKNMRARVVSDGDERLKTMFRDHECVGLVGLKYLIFRYCGGTYMCSLFAVLYELFYQRILDGFANLPQLRLNPPVKIDECLEVTECNQEHIKEVLHSREALLRDYFSISIEKGVVYSLPVVVEGYTPSLTCFPLFLRNIAELVNWEEEEECFDGIINTIASLYAAVEIDEDNDKRMTRLQNEIVNVLLPELKKSSFRPSKHLLEEESVIEIPYC